MRHSLVVLVVLIGCSATPAATLPTGPPAAASSVSPPQLQPPAPTVLAPAERPVEPGTFVVNVVDVGTGLAVLVDAPDFKLVYDAGSNDDLATGAKNRFTAYLHAAKPGLKKIDHVVLSHPHRDHVELLPDVISGYEVANVWDSGAINPICGYRRFIDTIVNSPKTAYHSGAFDSGTHELNFGKTVCGLPATAKVEHSTKVPEGNPIALGAGAKMTFLHVDGEVHGKHFNENSLVMLLELEGTKVLFMGDAEAGGRHEPLQPPSTNSVEGYVLAKYKSLIRSDVLIVGHHGSKSSSRNDFVTAVAPKISVISSGPTNYASVTLPDAEIVSEMTAASQLFRTDRDDGACATNKAKIGPDADGRPGGCDNVQITVHAGSVSAAYAQLTD